MNREIENSLKRSMEQLPHPSFEKIAGTPVVRMKEHDEITRQDKNRVYWHSGSLALACACLLLLIGTGWFANFRMVYSIVNVDVNPSLEIMVNRRDRVLSVKANNEEARELLEGRNYRGWDITEMVESLVDDLALQGYLTDERNVILLSVNSKSGKAYNGLQSALPEAVSGALADYGIIPRLFIQKLNVDKEAEKQAEQYHISLGRQQLINLMMKQNPSLKEGDLASMKVEELIKLAEKHGMILDGIEVWHEEKSKTPEQETKAPDTGKQPADKLESNKMMAPSTPAAAPAAVPSAVPPAHIRDDDDLDEESDDGEFDDDDANDDDSDDDDLDGKTGIKKETGDDDDEADEHSEREEIELDDDKDGDDEAGRPDRPDDDDSDDHRQPDSDDGEPDERDSENPDKGSGDDDDLHENRDSGNLKDSDSNDSDSGDSDDLDEEDSDDDSDDDDSDDDDSDSGDDGDSGSDHDDD